MGDVVNFSNKQEKENPEMSKDKKPAFQNLAGDYLAVFKMGKMTDEMVKVRPLREEDIWEMIGWANKNVEEKEDELSGELSARESATDEDVIEKGAQAKNITVESEVAVKGQKDLINKLREEVLKGLMDIMRSAPEVFIAQGSDAKHILDLKQADTKGQQLDASVDSTDITNRGAQWVLVVNPAVGEEIRQVFENNNHRTSEFNIGSGFSAEIGGIRMAFAYPDKVINDEGEPEEIKEEEDASPPEEELEQAA